MSSIKHNRLCCLRKYSVTTRLTQTGAWKSLFFLWKTENRRTGSELQTTATSADPRSASCNFSGTSARLLIGRVGDKAQEWCSFCGERWKRWKSGRESAGNCSLPRSRTPQVLRLRHCFAMTSLRMTQHFGANFLCGDKDLTHRAYGTAGGVRCGAGRTGKYCLIQSFTSVDWACSCPRRR